MMDFRFNFQLDDSTSTLNDEKTAELKIEPLPQKIHPSCSFRLKEALTKWDSGKECRVKVVTVGAEDFYVLASFQTEIDQESDRIPGVYEGGLKVWECSVDLARFICEGEIEVNGKFVCELGCGVGLPGIAALNHGCNELFFQDFDDYVLTNCTAPSLCCNRAMRQRKSPDFVISRNEIENVSYEFDNLHFVSGDWQDCDFPRKVDLILTAETVYDVNNYSKLHDLHDRLLAPHGMAFVASKAYYFGVGGGIHEWMKYCESKGIFDAEIARCVDAPLKRFIIKMTRKS